MQPAGLRIAAVSMNSPLGQPEKVLGDIDGWCRQAAEQGAELALFPELVVHGHCTPNTWDLAEAVPEGASVRRLLAFAKKYKFFLSAGLCEKEDDVVFNTQVLVGPDGYIGKQRKLHMSRDEGLHYKGGRELPVFDIGKAKLGIVICYDCQFPEPARILAIRGAEVLLMPHAARIETWDDTPQSMAAARRATYDRFVSSYAMRARENACFVVLADQAGRAGYVDMYPRDSPLQPHHAGAALVFAPSGDLIAETQHEVIQEEMLVCDLDPALLAAQRGHPSYQMKVRRPELFGELVEEQVKG